MAPGAKFVKIEDSRFGLALEVCIGGFVAGMIGQLKPGAARELDAACAGGGRRAASRRAAGCDARIARVCPESEIPAVTRDIAAILPRALGFGEVERVVREAKELSLRNSCLSTFFTDDSGVKLPADRKSLAFS